MNRPAGLEFSHDSSVGISPRDLWERVMEIDGTEKRIFSEAYLLSTSEERRKYVERVCEGNSFLCQRVLLLLKMQEEAPDFLDLPAVTPLHGTLMSESESDLPLTHIGPYRLKAVIGEGGMGVVYLAEQNEPIRRKVALKVIRPGMNSRHVISRFESERQALALMDHPHIARVLDAGTTEAGHPYFVMEFVDGLAITTFSDRERLSIRARIQLVVSVCRAVQHAHQKGIIHRDLKPSNVLIALHDGVPVPKVIDFGIAKVLNQPLTSHATFTGVGLLVGTPMYMSPEQAGLNGLDVDMRSDVYSLGVLLYELLTGVPPFDPDALSLAGPAGLPQYLRHTEPLKPSLRLGTITCESDETQTRFWPSQRRGQQHSLRGELDWVIMKAIDKDPNRRYASPAHLADDLNRYLRLLPVFAGPPTWLYRVSRIARRNRGILVTLLLILVALCAGLAVAVMQRSEALLAKQFAESALVDVRLQKKRAETLLYAADVRLAARALNEGDPHQTIQLLNRNIPDAEAFDLRGIEWDYLMRQAIGNTDSHPISDKPLYTISHSPDRKYVVTAGASGQITIVHAETLSVDRTISGEQGEVNGLTFSNNGKTLFSAGDDGTIGCWRFPEGDPVRTLRFGPEKAYLAIPSRDDQFLFVCGESPVVRILSLETGEQTGEIRQHDRAVETIALSPNGRWLACASSDRRLSVWDWQQERLAHLTQPRKSRLTSACFSSDGTRLVDGSVDGALRVIRTSDWRLTGKLNLNEAIQALAVAPDSGSVAVATRYGTIRRIQWAEFQRVVPDMPKTIGAAHRGRVYDLAWKDTETILSVGEDGHLHQCRFNTEYDQGRELLGIQANDAVVSPDGKLIAWIFEKQLGLWNRVTNQSVRLPAHPSVSMWTAISFSSDSEFLIAGTNDGRFAVASCRHPDQFQLHQLAIPGYISRIHTSRDGSRLAILCRTSDLIDIRTFPELQEVTRMNIEGNQEAAFSSDGKYFAFNDGRDAVIIETDTGRTVSRSSRHHSESINDLLFVGPEDLLLTLGDDRAVRLWDWRRGHPPELVGVHTHGAPIRLVATRDGRTLFTGSRGGEVLVWNLPSRQRLFPLMSSPTGILGLSLSADSRLLVVTEVNSRVRWFSLMDE